MAHLASLNTRLARWHSHGIERKRARDRGLIVDSLIALDGI